MRFYVLKKDNHIDEHHHYLGDFNICMHCSSFVCSFHSFPTIPFCSTYHINNMWSCYLDISFCTLFVQPRFVKSSMMKTVRRRMDVHTPTSTMRSREIHQRRIYREYLTYPYNCNIMVLSNPVAFSRMVLTLS